MSSPTAESSPQITKTGQWLALIAALLGWMFDGFEMGLFSMVGRAAIQDLMGFAGKPTEAQEAMIGFYFGVIIAVFLVGAATGGVLFGWLGDRLGRVRAMALSVATYAIFTGLCGIVSEPWQIAVMRFLASLGMGGEWSLGVALVMEVWPNRSRALMAGLIGAAANVGYLLVGVIGMGLTALLGHMEQWLLAIGLSSETTASLIAYKGWRLMMLIGATPALLTFLFRLFVPESRKWEHEKGRGATSQWATRDLLGVAIGASGPALIIFVWATDVSLIARLAGTLLGLTVATVGYVFPVVQYLKRTFALGGNHSETDQWRPTLKRMLLGACLSGVALLGTWGSTQWAPAWAGKLTQGTEAAAYAREYSQICLAIGAILGTLAAALMGDWLGRRVTYLWMCISSLVTVLLFFQGNKEFGPFFLVTCFLAGTCTAAFYGWLPLYLPELFATRVRATGQGFSFNFGRILAAIGALQAGLLTKVPTTKILGYEFEGGYPLACSAMSFIYVIGMGIIWLAPETKGQPLPE
jgi:MFS family permease